MIGVGPWRIVEGKSKKKSEVVCLGRSWVSNCYKSIRAAGAIALSVTFSGGAMFASWKLLSNSTPQTSCSKLGNWVWRFGEFSSLEKSASSTAEFGEISKLNPRAWRKYPNPTSEFGEISNLNPWVVEISLKHLRSRKCSLESRVSQQKSIEYR